MDASPLGSLRIDYKIYKDSKLIIKVSKDAKIRNR